MDSFANLLSNYKCSVIMHTKCFVRIIFSLLLLENTKCETLILFNAVSKGRSRNPVFVMKVVGFSYEKVDIFTMIADIVLKILY